MKKIVSRILAISMILGMFGVMPAKAETETVELYPDYVPAKEMPKNIMGEFDLTAEREWSNGVSRNTTMVDMSKDAKYGWKWGNSSCYTPITLIAQQDITSGVAGNFGLYGMMFKTWSQTDNLTREWFQFEEGKSYVVSLMVKDAHYDPGKPVYFQLCLTNEVANSTSFSKEYGKDGCLAQEEYTRYSDTIKPADGFDSSKANALIVGFDSAKAGSAISVRTEEAGDVYIGEEVAFDISNTLVTAAEDVCQGEDIKVKAAVLNQGGKAGYLEQNFNWYALDEEKTEEVEGFTFKNQGEGVATVTIASEVPVGRYAIVAESKDYEGFIKTAYIDVLPERIKDSVFDSEKPESVIKDSTQKTSVKATDSGAIALTHSDSDTVATATAKKDIANAKNMGMEGLEIHPAFNGFTSGFNFEAGKTYAFSAWVRKSSGSLEDTDVYFNVAIGQETADTLSYTNEYGTEGMKLTDDWQKFAATITVSENYDSEDTSKRHLYMGMPDGTLKGCAFDMKLDADYYLAENKSVGMIIEKIPADATTELTLENSLKLKGGYANQVGAISDEGKNIRWYILNSARKDIVDTLKITVSEDGKSAEVSSTEITNSGNYYVVLENEEEDGTLKRVSIPITVKKPQMAEAIINSLKNNSAEVLEEKIEIFARGLGIGFYGASAIDAEKCAALMKTEADTATLSTKADVKAFMEKVIFIATLNEGQKTDLLLNNKGKFVCTDSLDLKKYDTKGVTIYKLFTDTTEYEYIDNDGIKNIINSLKNEDFKNFTDFDERILEEIVLNIIAYPGVYGISYIDDVLTKENGERIGLDMTKYLGYSGDDKTAKNEEIARILFDKSTLQTTLDTEPEEEGGSGGGFGGGAPIKTGSDVKEPAVNPAPVVKEEVTNFIDVPDSHWAYTDIYHLKEIGVVSGVGYNTFLPDGTVTREQFVKMFVEAMEYDITAESANFSDVNDGDWYAPYVATAVNKGIITGLSSDTFGVGKPITRQDVCVIISRAMDNVDGSAEITFADATLIDEYAKDAISYLTSFNVIKGFSDNTFRPKDYCTRAQVAKIICTILNMKGLVV